MQTKPKPSENGTVLLELLFHNEINSKFVISMDPEELKTMFIFSFAQVDYISNDKKITVNVDEILYMLENLQNELILVSQNKRPLHTSIKQSLGYYAAKFYKKKDRKDLIYEASRSGLPRWVGMIYKLFDATGNNIPFSWLYNDSKANIILEISPHYQFFNRDPFEGEKFVKFSDWLKTYQPIEIVQIPQTTIPEWLNHIDKLMQRVQLSDEKYRCTGPGCELCKKEGKSGCPCGSRL